MAPGQNCVMYDVVEPRTEVCDSSFTYSVSGSSAVQHSGLTIRAYRTSCKNTERLETSVPYINLLKPSGNFTYHQV
jgi:hypothetical protein